MDVTWPCSVTATSSFVLPDMEGLLVSQLLSGNMTVHVSLALRNWLTPASTVIVHRLTALK